MQFNRIYIIGAPGAGKGSLCAMLSADYNYHHLSVGDLLRHLARSNTLRPDIMRKIRGNDLLDTRDLIPILKNAIETLPPDIKERLLIDGIPRVLGQAGPVEDAIGSPDLVLFFNCPGAVAKERFLTRKIPGRNDNWVAFNVRYGHYYAENERIVEHYRARGVLVEVDTSGDFEESYDRLLDALRARGVMG
ncbi:nucleoside monophosphate kinase [Aspergillus ibericus CBS 121593]|uniref:P-loop containing nucleoside triphosphate hydrolase protein n=1 Tax=Aspergillus ibericus CBS 121593 TaxID=1448316 RepID=A0A395GP83_9EURO|nr:P-loop containing nucleoside triphosphate hydrolase protein [Aspergillus ibericus CBS 121593]RAK97305.1 P-loop containing nucleoside triphosphate hydrolase protein [Aspergillus ibericus CBS 121593]